MQKLKRWFRRPPIPGALLTGPAPAAESCFVSSAALEMLREVPQDGPLRLVFLHHYMLGGLLGLLLAASGPLLAQSPSHRLQVALPPASWPTTWTRALA